MTNAALSIHGNWHYKYRKGFIKISDSGSFDVDVSGVFGSVSVTLGVTQTGEPTIRSTACNFKINTVSIHLHGGASWLYDLFKKFIEKGLRRNMQDKICAEARKAIDVNAARELATLKVQIVIDEKWLLDYRLVSPPSFGENFFESYLKGEFFFAGQQIEAPFKPASLPLPKTADHMVSFWMSDYVLNTVGYTLHQHNVLMYNLTQKDLPDDQKVILNTTCCSTCNCIGKILPAISKAYPDAVVEAFMATSEPPLVDINPNTVRGNFSGIIDLTVRLHNGTVAHLFKIKVVAEISIRPTFDGMTLKATVSRFDEKISVVSSSIGPVPEILLEFFFNNAKKLFIIPQLNNVGSKGFPLPHVDHVQFVNTSLQLMSNCVSLRSDIQYNARTLYFQPQVRSSVRQ